MPQPIKWFFTIVGLLVVLVTLFVRRIDDGKRSSAFWCGGQQDLIRRFLADSDGYWHWCSKLVIVLLGFVWIVLIWST